MGENAECKAGRDQVIAKIQETNRSGEVDEEQIRHAMADPEIQNILHDPQINMFLKEMQQNPKEAQKAMMADPKLQEADSKQVLVYVGSLLLYRICIIRVARCFRELATSF